MVGLSEIRQMAEQIAREFRPERIILFGSHARGNPTADSDVDVLILAGHEGQDWEYAGRIRSHLHTSFPLDVLVRTPEYFDERLAMDDPFLGQIAREGVILYEANHG